MEPNPIMALKEWLFSRRGLPAASAAQAGAEDAEKRHNGRAAEKLGAPSSASGVDSGGGEDGRWERGLLLAAMLALFLSLVFCLPLRTALDDWFMKTGSCFCMFTGQ